MPLSSFIGQIIFPFGPLSSVSIFREFRNLIRLDSVSKCFLNYLVSISIYIDL